ncbi:dTDP-4-dehydrorhamnose reductase [Tateyamaria sp.]|uniref:dTDP-4-dehydrorhamnose reductase n=1 Tax=Tateyamaria sp. TaxID=1929288 RepID=UPI0032A07AB3
MKVLVFGLNGQVAIELKRQPNVVVESLGRDVADLTKPEECVDHIARTDADVVINAAAYTAVDAAESDVPTATMVNATSPGAMARACAARDLPFIHISTDYVFDGAGEGPFHVDHTPDPLGVYGQTKLDGEEAVRQAGGTFAIFRTSWVVSAHGNNFVKTMLRLGAERDELNVVDDQIGGPTPAAHIAATCVAAAEQLLTAPSKTGTYHLSGGPDVSWAEFARAIFEMADINCTVKGIPSSQYPTPAPRPKNSRLDNSQTEQVFGLKRYDWKSGLSDILKELEELSA